MKKIILSVCFCSALALAGEGAPGGKEPCLKLKAGQRAVDFSLRDLENNMVRLSDWLPELRDRPKRPNTLPVLIDFFRTDCEPCKKELPQIVKLHQKKKDQLRVIVVALLEEEQGQEKLRRFFSENKVPFPVVIDAYESVAGRYIACGESLTLPAIFLIGGDGIIKKARTGLEQDMTAWVGESEPISAKDQGRPLP